MAKSNLHRYSVQEALNIQTGAGGCDLVIASGSDVTLNAHTYCAITALNADCDLDLTSTDTDIWDSHTTLIVPVGTTIYGSWGTVVVADGHSAIVYIKASFDVPD